MGTVLAYPAIALPLLTRPCQHSRFASGITNATSPTAAQLHQSATSAPGPQLYQESLTVRENGVSYPVIGDYMLRGCVPTEDEPDCELTRNYKASDILEASNDYTTTTPATYNAYSVHYTVTPFTISSSTLATSIVHATTGFANSTMQTIPTSAGSEVHFSTILLDIELQLFQPIFLPPLYAGWFGLYNYLITDH